MFQVKDEDAPKKLKSSKNQIQSPRGMPDILPSEHRYFTFIKKVIRHRCRQAGLQRITTPVAEATDLFTRSVGESSDIVGKEMYTFKDKKKRSLSLRPEGTAPVVRAYLQHAMYNLPQPVELFYLEPMWRYERPQAGRQREFWQFGVEVIGGENDPVIDAQIMNLGWKVITDLGLSENVTIQINSIGCPACKPKYKDALLAYYSEKKRSLCSDCKKRLDKNPLRLLDCKNEDCKILAENAPKPTEHLCKECEDHFTKLQEFLTVLKLPFEINSQLVRGLDYYSKTVFEFWDTKKKGKATLLAGGRYDSLVSDLGGPESPALGFAMGFERIILEMKAKKIGVPHKDKVQIFIAQLGHDAKTKCLPLISDLRSLGLHTANSLGRSSLKFQLKLANKLDAEWAVIIGDMEVRDDTALLRDMRTGEQQIIPFDQIKKTLKNIFPKDKRDTYSPGELKWVEGENGGSEE